MGRHSRRTQVVVYLPPELHDSLRVRAAQQGTSMSDLVEQSIRGKPGIARSAVPIGPEADTAQPEIVDALIALGAPLWGRGAARRPPVAATIARAIGEARNHPAILRVLPLVLQRHAGRLSWKALRAAVAPGDLAALGMVLDLSAAATGSDRLARWARALWNTGVRQEPEAPFFDSPSARSPRYLELAAQRTPEVVRRWGFLMATPLDDFRAAVERFS
jgi:hypothetical protein